PLQHLEANQRSTTQHSIQVGDLHIPLELRGTMSGFTTRKPTTLEVNDKSGDHGIHIYMTSDATWDPHSKQPADIKSNLWDSLPTPHSNSQLSPLQVRGLEQATDQSEAESMPFYCDLPPDPKAKDPSPRLPSPAVQCIAAITSTRSSAALDVDSYAEVLLQGDSAGESGPMLAPLSTVKKRKGFVDAASLAANWKIGLELACLTVNGTTQRAVRDFTHSTGGRRIKPYAWMLKWPRLQCPFYTDTLHGKMISLRGNKCAQIYATTFGFVAAHPIKSKSEAHLTLDDVFWTVGIPSSMVPDNAKELTEGEF
ncbi:MAG: hypothetical protein ACRCZI_12135, partial [Cetobacterium sp.]